MKKPKEYLGDGVYVEDDGFGGVWLTTQRENGEHRIYLEPEVYAALKRYMEGDKE